MSLTLPRLVVAGTGGDAGKTLVSLALVAALRARGNDVSAFKKGPDYIDRAWLEWASGREARNLDTFLLGRDRVRASFIEASAGAELAVVEGNRGLHDGLDQRGEHSTAELAKLLDAPVLLLVDGTKVTRTAAAVALGVQRLDPSCRICGVVLNRVAGDRHERVLRDSVTSITGLPVLGVVRRSSSLAKLLPDRHLGLVTPAEHHDAEGLRAALVALAESSLDLDALLRAARGVEAMEETSCALWPGREVPAAEPPVRIGYLVDRAFTFYYPENLEALRRAGAELVPVSAVEDRELPRVDGLYLGGGFPETQAQALAENVPFKASLRAAIDKGLPTYAECGGLMYLGESFAWDGAQHEMTSVLPLRLTVGRRPQGHGYEEVTVTRPTAFFEVGTRLRGHEFHYSSVVHGLGEVETAYRVGRGTGLGRGVDGVVLPNGLASYLHLHALSAPEWAPALVRRAMEAQRAARSAGSSKGAGDQAENRRIGMEMAEMDNPSE